MVDELLVAEHPSQAIQAAAVGTEAHHMDIATAKRFFLECREELVEGYRNVADYCREHQISAPLPNDNFVHALTLTDLMFDKCQRSLRMLTGGHGDGFIGCLKDTFVKMLHRLKKNSGVAQILVLNGGSESKLLDSLAAEFPGTLKIAKGRIVSGAVSHCIVADNEMVRDEQPHEPLAELTSANVIKANVYFHSPGMADLFSKRFDAIWERVARS